MTELNAETHKRQAEKHKVIFEEKLAKAQKTKGLLIVNTGTGKGKSTAAFGMGIRILGHNLRLGVVQFIKGAIQTAERTFLMQNKNCDFHTIGDGYTWNTQNLESDIVTARRGWLEAQRMIGDAAYDMVILDELNVVLKHQYLPLEEVLETLTGRRDDLHVVVTGRHAPETLIEAADLVSEMRMIKHPYKEQGIKAQAGIEF
ncbi:cob(I)yrinic acid a,c-diamide adenosyltransferase [soil metagenome]